MADAILAQSGIYAIRNIVNGKRYVGQSSNINERARSHFGMLRVGTHHCRPLQRSYVKHGKDMFVHEILELCDIEQLTGREQHWMDFYRADGLYNLAPAAGSNVGYKHTAETRAKYSAAKTGLKHSEENRASRRASFTEERREISRKNGLRHADRLRSDEHRALISAATLGVPRSEEVRSKISTSNKGKPKSQAHRKSLSEARVGMKASEVTREKMRKSQALAKDLKREKAIAQWAKPGAREAASESRKGRVVSDATREKLRMANLLRWARHRQAA
jgi:group I intron endonuclease